MLTVECVENAPRFEALRDEWSELLADSAVDGPFLTWEWLYTWWRHLAGDRRLHLLAVRRGRRLAAIAPFAVRPSSAARPALLPFRAVEFLGTGTVGSDYLDVIVRRGEEPRVLPLLANQLVERGLATELRQVDAGSANVAGLALELEARGWTAVRSVTEVCPYIELDGDWEAYLDSLGSAHRYNVRRRLRKLALTFAVELEEVRDEARRAACLELLVELHRKRWRERGGSDALDGSALVGFHDAWSQLALARGWLRLYVLWLSGKPAAALYGLRYGDTFYFYQAGFDPAYAGHSVGLVMQGLAIHKAIEEGAKVYDMLHGVESYKALWARKARDLVRVDFYPPTLAGTLLRQTMALRQSVKQRLLRRTAPRWVIG